MRNVLGWIAVAVGLFLAGGGVYAHVQTGEAVGPLIVTGTVFLVLGGVALTTGPHARRRMERRMEKYAARRHEGGEEV